MGMFDDEESPHIAQHHQDMLVHGVDMEQVMLHLPDDLAKHPQITPQDRGLVHQAHGVRQAIVHQDLAKGLPVHRIVAETAIHLAARVVEGAQGAGRQALDADRGLVHQKGLQNGVGFALVEVVAGDIDHPGLLVEAGVDRLRCVGGRVEPLFDVEQQDLVELGDGLGGPVVTPHQRLAGAYAGSSRAGCCNGAGGRSTIAKGLGHGSLQVEHKAVFTPLRDEVKPCADQGQQGLVAFELAEFEGRGQAAPGQGVPGVTKPGRLGDPQDDMQITQAAGRLFAIGLERVGRIFKLVMALLQLEGLCNKKGLWVECSEVLVLKAGEQRFIAGDQACLQQRCLHGNVAGRLLEALLDCTHA